MKKIGLTGGIGSGKSTVASIFSQLGVPVFNSDFIARELQDNDPALKKNIQTIFGSEIYNNGKLDRVQLAGIVFTDKNKLDQLTAIVHPAVAQAFDTFCEVHKNAKYILKEAAILFEIGDDQNLDSMLVVAAPFELRLSRVTKRDGITEEQVLKRLANQFSQDEIIKKADFVIVNDEIQMLLPQVLALHNQLSAS